MIVSLVSLIFVDEGFSFGDCLYERKQSFLVGLVHGQDLLDVAIFARFQG